MNPTVGRIVHYFENEGDPEQAAIVTGINYEPKAKEEGNGAICGVDLKVFHKQGLLDLVCVPQRKEQGQLKCWDWPEKF